ncbi:hypothetical protein [Reichenbachiella ulvae]|uniref:LTXXQ motif family protein n=1 Tax=Reichenbachiella ulvae TaxID=2980104 RepID=A0ABT3CY61_9BACT|nr:hypothetical protein [Reichenbachiella ulvae]MCV9388640.1 hypothetical protein [Reichenbachiella ulvae]
MSASLRMSYHLKGKENIMNKRILLFIAFFGLAFLSMAQPRMSMKDRVMREKQNLYGKIDNLSEDQTMIIDGIYDEYAVSMEETFEEIRKTRNWDEMRTKMEALNLEKDGLMYDILNKEQYAIYAEMTEAQRKEMEERRKQSPAPNQ